MNELEKSQVYAVLTAAHHNLKVVLDQLVSIDDVDGIDVSPQIKELGEAVNSIEKKIKELS